MNRQIDMNRETKMFLAIYYWIVDMDQNSLKYIMKNIDFYDYSNHLNKGVFYRGVAIANEKPLRWKEYSSWTRDIEVAYEFSNQSNKYIKDKDRYLFKAKGKMFCLSDYLMELWAYGSIELIEIYKENRFIDEEDVIDWISTWKHEDEHIMVDDNFLTIIRIDRKYYYVDHEDQDSWT